MKIYITIISFIFLSVTKSTYANTQEIILDPNRMNGFDIRTYCPNSLDCQNLILNPADENSNYSVYIGLDGRANFDWTITNNAQISNRGAYFMNLNNGNTTKNITLINNSNIISNVGVSKFQQQNGITGSFIVKNNGLIQGSNPPQGNVSSLEANFNGGIDTLFSLENNGTITSYAYPIYIKNAYKNIIKNNINGTISSDAKYAIVIDSATNGTTDIENMGSISSSTSTSTSTPTAGIYVNNSEAKITNYGDVEGTYSIYLINSSKSEITNYGVLNGDIKFSNGKLDLLSINNISPEVNGDIKGENNSIINIGSNQSKTIFNTKGEAKATNINILTGSQLNLNTNYLWTATGLIGNSGIISIQTNPLSSTYNLEGNLLNKGEINLKDSLVDQRLSVNGNYVGQGGYLLLNTTLNDDNNSPTDKLTISGNVTGSTQLKVINAGGFGAQTVNGIKVIETGYSDENAFFIANGGYVSAGAYDYGLSLENNTDWYLKSHLRDDTPIYTPDVGSYLATETMGNTLFTSRLEDREGASQYQNHGNNNDIANVWVRAYGGHNKFKTMDSQLKTIGHSFVTQIGAGLVTLGEEDQYNLGAMGGFAYYDSKTRSNLTDRKSKTKVDGYSLGLYGTWNAHPVEKRGAYIDSWVLWNKFNNKIDTPDQNQYKYDSSGITASIEAGGNYLINKNGQKDWWIQPQVQLIYQGVHADNFKDSQGVDIYHGKDNVQTRVGVKTYLDIPTKGNQFTSYRPYVALNYIHNTNPYSVVINDVRFKNEGSANLSEFKLGIEGNMTKNSQVWLNASYVAGSHDNQAYQGNIGWKYNF